MNALLKLTRNRAASNSSKRFVRRYAEGTRLEEDPSPIRKAPAQNIPGGVRGDGTPAASQESASRAPNTHNVKAPPTYSAGKAQATEKMVSTPFFNPQLWFGIGILGVGAYMYYRSPGSSDVPQKEQANDVHQIARQNQTQEAALRASPDVPTNQKGTEAEPNERDSKIK